MTLSLELALILLNIATFATFALDKWKARQGRWRIPEKTLLIMAAVGGSLGAWCGMIICRHKTQHTKFKLVVPMLLLAHCVMLALYYNKVMPPN